MRYDTGMSDENKEKNRYHHGDLRSALLAAAEVELQENGVERFSLRSVAKRAGVSHAAPAHHFQDANGLLTALATEGFRQFLATMKRHESQSSFPPLEAAGLGYVEFARERPALFTLIFSSERPDFADTILCEAADAAFDHLVDHVSDLGGDAMDVASVWAMAHGLAGLMSAGRLKMLGSLPSPSQEEALVRLLRRSFPDRHGQRS